MRFKLCGDKSGACAWRVDRALRSYWHSVPALLLIISGNRIDPLPMLALTHSHWHASTSSGLTTGRVEWQQQEQERASLDQSPHGLLAAQHQSLQIVKSRKQILLS